MEEDLVISEEASVGIEVEIIEEGNVEAEVVEEVTFEEPINLEEYDEFSLTRVVQRKLQNLSEQAVRETVLAKEKSLDVNSIDEYLKCQEDEEELTRVENEQKRVLELKLLESVADISLEDEENTDEAESAKKISSEAMKSTKVPNTKVNNTWVDIGKLPPQAFEKLRPNMALTYPFELDEFQKQAVLRLENREHVFVAAHTSAGKTVVAEYAIALALKNNTRAVYTSPIKALSNQKYRDFKEKFGADNVGIVTGDVSVNPQAKCLIMTTEIFRSMLYKGSDTIRDVEFVVFDEVHYVNDAERGVVWEEVIIMLQQHVCLIFLSATTPNAKEFSEWIGRTKQKRVYLISTNKRPVPLHHVLYYDNEVYSLMEGNKYNPEMIARVKHITAEKNKPKPLTAENQQMANQRKHEKANIAAQAAGGNKAKQQQIMQKVMNGGGRGGGGGGRGSGRGSGGGTAPKGSNSGTSPQWNTLIKLLQQGGREAAGGLGPVHFGDGVATSRTVLTPAARKEKENKYVPYEKLPAELRNAMTRRDYEAEEFRASESDPDPAHPMSGDVRSSDNNVRSSDMGCLPVVIFSFSKKKCEVIADYLSGQDLLTRTEKKRVFLLFTHILTRIPPVDHDLPQILRMREMLFRGIGIHHSGLLPILKEAVEILFAQSVVKVLLATETFAMGVNMPARSVVFNGYRKHDGRTFRDLLPGEYVQMAGRAGRRGLDSVGTVLLAAWMDLPEPLAIKQLLTGKPTILASQFRLRYTMILNLVRANTMTIQDMMKSSFTEYAAQKTLSGHNLLQKLTRYETYLSHLKTEHYEACWTYLTTVSPHATAYLAFLEEAQTSDQTSSQTSDQTSDQTSAQTYDQTSTQTSDQTSSQTSTQTYVQTSTQTSPDTSFPSGMGVIPSPAASTPDDARVQQDMTAQRVEEKRSALLSHYYEEIAAYAKTYSDIQDIFHKQLVDVINWNATTMSGTTPNTVHITPTTGHSIGHAGTGSGHSTGHAGTGSGHAGTGTGHSIGHAGTGTGHSIGHAGTGSGHAGTGSGHAGTGSGHAGTGGKKGVVTVHSLLDTVFASGHVVHVWDTAYTTYPVVGIILTNVTDTKTYFADSVPPPLTATESVVAEKKLTATEKLSVSRTSTGGGGGVSAMAAARASLMATNQQTPKAPTATHSSTTQSAPGGVPGLPFTPDSLSTVLTDTFVYVLTIFSTIDLVPQWCLPLIHTGNHSTTTPDTTSDTTSDTPDMSSDTPDMSSDTFGTSPDTFGTIHDFLVSFTAKKTAPGKDLPEALRNELVFFGHQRDVQQYYLIFPVALSAIYTLYTPLATLSATTTVPPVSKTQTKSQTSMTNTQTSVTKQSVGQVLDALLLGMVLDADTGNSSGSSGNGNTGNAVDWVEYQKQFLIKDVAFLDRHVVLKRYSAYLRHSYVYPYLFPQITHTTNTSTTNTDTNTSSTHTGTLLPPLPVIFPHVTAQARIARKVQYMEHFISDKSMSLFPDLTQRVQVLSALAYLDPTASVITTKGRVACELNTCDELLGTEMLFHNLLEPLNPPEAVGLLSALVFQEKSSTEGNTGKDEIAQGDPLTSRMEVAKEEMMTIFAQLKSLQKCYDIELDVDLKPILNFGLCAVVYQWARGVPFKEIVTMSEFQEGSIVRCITRLDELCRDIQKAARVMGNMSLYYKMEAASQCIKRDIVFAASLYIV